MVILGFWIPRCAFRIPCQRNLDSGIKSLAGFRRSVFYFFILFYFLIGLSYVFIDAVVGGSKSDERLGPFHLNF